jgi:membrane-associated phospholipid phosphatase
MAMGVVVLFAVTTSAGMMGWLSARAVMRRWSGRASGGTVALVAMFVLAALVFSLLALAVRHSSTLVAIDAAAARWAEDANGDSHGIIEGVTDLGSTPGVIAIAVVVGLFEWRRAPSPWIPVFLATVVVGDIFVTTTLKEVVARTRPEIHPLASATHGRSFPSSHSSAAAASYAALALLAPRGRSGEAKAAFAGIAVGIAGAVAASRVLLDVHWVSDAFAGLTVGWGWFAVCTMALLQLEAHAGTADPEKDARRVLQAGKKHPS